MKRTVSIEEAKAMAAQSGLAAVASRVEKAENDGWDVITFEARLMPDGSWDIGAAAPTGVMIAWMLPSYVAEKVAIPGGEPAGDLHVTLAYLGDDAANLSADDQRKLIGITAEVCARHTAAEGHLQGTGRFVNGEETDAYWVGVNIPGLAAIREDLRQSLEAAGIPLQGRGAGADYTPHVTVAYLPADTPTPAMDYKPESVCMDRLTVCVGPNRFHQTIPYPETEPWEPGGWAPQVITKAVQEDERYTLGVWYIPDRLDAHGEWTDARELQKTFHDYLAKEDRGIRLQHNTDIIAGHWVDGMVMPSEWTTTITKADGTTEEFTYPAGTPFLGVRWEDWAWQLVKAGKIRGYSIGGTGKRMLVDIPEANPEP
jgi:hypothetical protein